MAVVVVAVAAVSFRPREARRQERRPKRSMLFLAYVKALVATARDTAEPADVRAFDPPTTTETKEPIATQ